MLFDILRKILFFLSPRDKTLALGVLGLMLIGAVLEATGIALIFPVLALISNPKAIETSVFLKGVYQYFDFQTPNELLVWMVGILLVFYAIKYVYLAGLYYLQYLYIFNLQVKLSNRLLETYVRSPYPFHLRRNSAELLRNVNSDVLWIFSGVLVPAFVGLIEVFVVSIILLVLLYAAPLVTIATIIVLGLTSFSFYYVIRMRAASLGEIQQSTNAEMIKWVNQSLGGAKEIKILGREDYFLEKYNKNNIGYGRSMRYLRTLGDLPRLIFEALLMTSVLLVVGFMLVFGQNLETMIPILGLFAMAAVRLMPSMNRILSGLTSVRYYTASVDRVYQDLKEFADDSAEAELTVQRDKEISFDKEIELENVSFRYEGAEKLSLTNINLKIPKGSSVAFVGSSGAGKTTIIDVILGLLKPTGGSVKVDGVNINDNSENWQRKIGYIPQPIYLSDDTIRRNVAFGLDDDKIDESQLLEVLEAAQLSEFIENLPAGLDTNVGENGVTISAGQRQRIGIARALYHNPEILVLDEATAALDNKTELEITKAIDALSHSKTILSIAHRLSTVKNFDCLYFMKNGEIVDAANYEDLLLKNTDFQQMVNPVSKISQTTSTSN